MCVFVNVCVCVRLCACVHVVYQENTTENHNALSLILLTQQLSPHTCASYNHTINTIPFPLRGKYMLVVSTITTVTTLHDDN